MPEPGFAVEFNVDPQGSELAVAALSTDSVLYVEDSSAYDAPGTVEINDVQFDLVATDVDAGTITLGAALGAAADIGDRVFISGGGEIAYDHTLEIHTADGEPLEIAVDFSDRALWGEPGPIDPPVPVILSDDLTQILDVPGRRAMISPSSFVVPLGIAALTSNQTIPNGAGFTDMTGWVVTDLQGGMEYDGLGSFIAPLNGYYTATGAILWDSNPTGRRAVQPSFFTAFGPVLGGLMNQPADASAQQTTPIITPTKRLSKGETMKVTVSQTSGGNLDAIGNADGTKSFICIKYEGPF